jgi:hopanoid biosynthesis associated radical SAM protein HpnH
VPLSKDWVFWSGVILAGKELMGVPVSQMWTVATYVLTQRMKGRKRYPLVLMLEPLFRCNLACAGCGKIQYPAHILKSQLTAEQCFKAAEECGAPMVSIPGGEPLLHPQIQEIVEGLIARKKYIYLCTNALLLKEKMDLFKPSKYLTFSVHLDGQKEHHDFSVCREGTYDVAVAGISKAVQRGFRVTTNTTLFDGADPVSVRAFFDEMMRLGVEGMMLSPGYSYDKAADQEHFLGRAKTRRLFGTILSNRDRKWRFNQSPLFLEFLMGRRSYTCTPWGMPTYNIFGWQKPCYLLQDGYVDTFQELLDATNWEKYGTESGNPRCANCMVHSGYEASAVHDTFSSLRGFLATVKASLFGGSYVNREALEALRQPPDPPREKFVPLSVSASRQSHEHTAVEHGSTRTNDKIGV